MDNFKDIAKLTKEASILLSALDTETKNSVLIQVADVIEKNALQIYEANSKDLDYAQGLVDKGELSLAVYKRLKLDENKLRDMVQGIRDLVELPDPVNRTILKRELDTGLILEKISCPIGVIGVVFEARPDVIAQISALAIKSGNAVILKGGSHTLPTNRNLLPSLRLQSMRVTSILLPPPTWWTLSAGRPVRSTRSLRSHSDMVKMPAQFS